MMERTCTGDSYLDDYYIWNLKPYSLVQLKHASEESTVCTIVYSVLEAAISSKTLTYFYQSKRGHIAEDVIYPVSQLLSCSW